MGWTPNPESTSEWPRCDVAMLANSAAGAEFLRKHTGWLKAFGPGSVVQEPLWGVVAYHVPVKSMKLTPETMNEVAAELLRQNNWGDSARIQYLGLLTRPGIRAEGSILIEFTSPVMANRAIITGVVWGKQIHNASHFCREGRTKLCRKCQKRGISSHTVPTSSTVATVPTSTRPGSVRRHGARRYQSSRRIAAEDIVPPVESVR